MPLIRKILAYGKTSRGIILPASWLQYLEEREGQPIKAVAIEVNNVLKISPILPKTEADSS